MGFQLPRHFLLAIFLSYLGFGFYLYFTNINFFVYLNQTLASYNIPLVFPIPFENYWALIYAAVPAGFSILITFLVARGEIAGETS